MTDRGTSNGDFVSPTGPLPVGWDLVRLADITTKVGSGATPKGGEKVYLRKRISHALVRSQHVFDRRFDSGGLAYISEDHAHGLRNAELLPGDILLNITGDGITFGRACIVPDSVLPACVNQHVSIIRVDKTRCHPGYLVSYLTHPTIKNYIESFNAGGSRRAITKGHIESFEVPLPPFGIQQRIADILGTLDDKIELNRRMNETLETMARRLFRSCFVEFDPVHAKAALRREHPELSNADLSRRALPRMAPEIAELFPDSFEDSTLGPIPKGWKVGAIGELAALDKSSVTPSAFPDEVFDHYSIPAFDDGMNPVKESGDQIKSNKFVVTPDCVLLTKLNPRIPRVWLPFPSHSRRSLCSTEFLVLKPNSGVSREFLFSLVSSRSFFEVYETMVTGTSGSHQRIRPEHLLKMEVVIPPEPIRTAFAEKVGDQFTYSETLRSESRSLATTRDRLLPKLLAGELLT